MKKLSFSLLLCLLCLTTGLKAQSLLNGDVNSDGVLTVGDVSKTVNMLLGKETQTYFDLAAFSYFVDNTAVVGKWYRQGDTAVTFNADGTTDWSTGYTYKFRPVHGTILIIDNNKVPVKTLVVDDLTENYLLVVDYATQQYTFYTKNETLASSISLSKSSVTLNPADTQQLTATVHPSSALGSVVWSSSNTSVATVDDNGLVTAVSAGTCNITCAAIDGSCTTATCTVRVTNDVIEYIDLGLPSGTLWATCNVGASSPEQFGNYFAWGETTGYNEGKVNFLWTNYAHCNGSWDTFTKYCWDSTRGQDGYTDTLTELELCDDAAYVNWGSNWRMPSRTQFEELINSTYTTVTSTTQNGVTGKLITSKQNGNSIFLPAAGYYGATTHYSTSKCVYWTNTLDTSDYTYRAYYYNDSSLGATYRLDGKSVRPVRNE